LPTLIRLATLFSYFCSFMKDFFTEKDRKNILLLQKQRHLNSRQLKEIPMFFVVGRPRSGTTLLRTLFDAHPNVMVPPECQLIINLYPKYGKITNWSKKQLQSFYEDLFRQWRFDLWPLDRNKLYHSLMQCRGDYSYGTLCKLVYHEYRSIFRHGVILALGDKNPGYTIYTERLLKIFPEARFIHIVRDYRDNFVSIRNVDFELPFISVTTSKWRYFVKKFRQAAGRYPGTHKEIRYEDLVSRPEEVFSELCRFIGIPFSPVPFDFYKKSSEVLKIYPNELILKYHSSLLKKINTGRTGLWKKELKPSEIRVADACAGPYAALTGHEKAYPKPGIRAHICCLPGKAFAGMLYMATWMIDKFPYRLRMTILSKAPLAVGRFYLGIFNRKKLRELDGRMKQMSQKSGNSYRTGWKPLYKKEL
jgi:hypothetical protein